MDSSIVLLFAAATIVVILVIGYGTVAKTKWGINFSQLVCPKCHTPQPRGPRVPQDAYEASWGGMTCAQCGAKMDKWGRLRV
jgi:hypothetical protein